MSVEILSSGDGAEKFYVQDGTLFSYWGSAWGVTVPAGVTRIGANAFLDQRDRLRSICLPEGLESIEAYAFCGCEALECVSLPEGLRTIGKSAFEGCERLASVSLPESLRTIGADSERKSAQDGF